MPPDKGGGGTSCCTLHIGCLLHTLLLHTLLHTQLHPTHLHSLPIVLTELAAEQHTQSSTQSMPTHLHNPTKNRELSAK